MIHVFILNLPCGARGCNMLLALLRMQLKKVYKHCCTQYICQTEPRFTLLPHLPLLTYLQYFTQN